MSEHTSGVVQYIHNKGKAWSFKVDEVWYGHGFEKPKFAVNDTIEFDFDVNGQFKNVVKSSVKTVKKEVSVNPVTVKAQGKDGFWEAKEQRDISTQKAIQYQASRNAAISLVDLMLKYEAIKLPAKVADREEVIYEAVNTYTGMFNDATTAVMSGNEVETTKNNNNNEDIESDDDSAELAE